MDQLNYNQLYYFYVVAKAGSIKSACKKLHLTQPTISGQIKKLETELGYKLFIRKHRKLELTQKGKLVLKKSEQVFQVGQEILAINMGDSDHPQNPLRIGLTPALPNALVEKFVSELWRNSNSPTHLSHDLLKDLLTKLDSDQIDLIVSDSPLANSRKYKSICIAKQNLIAVGSRKLAKSKTSFPNSLNQQPYLSLSPDSSLQQEIDFYFKIKNMKPKLIGSADSDSLITSLITNNKAFSILPALSVNKLIREKKLTKLGTLKGIDCSCWVTLPNWKSHQPQLKEIMNRFLRKNVTS